MHLWSSGELSCISKLSATKLLPSKGHSTDHLSERLSDISKGLATRVAGAPPVSMPDKEKTFPELRERIEKTLIILEGLSPNNMELMEDQEIILPTPWGDKTFASGKTYVLEYVIPSFYFHYCMAYALMRKEGVQIGKLDYLGLSLE